MSLSSKFQQHLHAAFPQLFTPNRQWLLAVSGGADSVALVDLLDKAGIHYTIAHCNFQLRGEESKRDEDFVQSLGKKYGKEVLLKKFDTEHYAAEHRCAIQEAARDLRYNWFASLLAADDSFSGIITAHHADDSIETLLMHFFRGTGIQGLTGIQPWQKDRKLLRPLLPFHKQELLEYLTQNGLTFVEDSSNASDKYTRNFFRNRLIPQIKEVFPQVENNLMDNLQRFQEQAMIYEKAVQLQLKNLAEQKGNEWHIPVLKWKKLLPLHTLSYELIKPFGFTAAQTRDVIRLLDADTGSYIVSSTHRIIRNRQWMIITTAEEKEAQHILIERGEKQVSYPDGSITIEITSPEKYQLQNNPAIAALDADSIRFPLLLRKWKTGDYFYPLGMPKKKKLSRFFIDSKLSRTAKEKVWVIESNQKIVWVVGHRIDNRYKITANTRHILQLTCRGNETLR